MDSLPLPALFDTWTAPAIVPFPYQPYPNRPSFTQGFDISLYMGAPLGSSGD